MFILYFNHLADKIFCFVTQIIDLTINSNRWLTCKFSLQYSYIIQSDCGSLRVNFLASVWQSLFLNIFCRFCLFCFVFLCVFCFWLCYLFVWLLLTWDFWIIYKNWLALNPKTTQHLISPYSYTSESFIKIIRIRSSTWEALIVYPLTPKIWW